MSSRQRKEEVGNNQGSDMDIKHHYPKKLKRGLGQPIPEHVVDYTPFIAIHIGGRFEGNTI